MNALPIIIFNLAAGILTGAVIFQSAIVAPAVFSELDQSAARRFLRSVFPRFFKLSLALSVVAAVSAGVAGTLGGWPTRAVVAAVAAVLMAVCAALALAMIPSINAARDAGPAGAARFATLHRANVLLTVTMLLAAIVILVTTGLGAHRGS